MIYQFQPYYRPMIWRDAHGHPRELHTELAAEAIDYTVLDDYQTHYQAGINLPTSLVQCAYFQTTLYQVTDQVEIDWTNQQRFLIAIVTKGNGTLIVDDEPIPVCASQTYLIPATSQHISVKGDLTLVTVTCA